MTILRTPDERFEMLPGFPYEPHYLEQLPGYEGLRLHYVDAAPTPLTTATTASRSGDARDHAPGAAARPPGTWAPPPRHESPPVFLCLHGEPTWAYLYRKMIPVFTQAGCRVVVPDFFGFGRSDKPVEDQAYTFHFHRDALMRFIEALDLRNVVLVVQDWGGFIGLTLPMEYPDRITGLLIMNTDLPAGRAPSVAFYGFKAFMAMQRDPRVGWLMRRAVPGLSAAEAEAYAAPFPDARYKAGVRRFPRMVMVRPDMEGVEVTRAARDYLARNWSGPTFMAVGTRDPFLGPPVMNRLRETIQAAPEPLRVRAGHFVQEAGREVAGAALGHFMGVHPAPSV